jgi:syncollin
MVRHVMRSVAASAAILALWSTAQAGCTVYQHRDYGGSSWSLDHNGTLQMAGERQCHSQYGCNDYEPSWNDQISSFRVDGGCVIELWQHTHRGGAKFNADKSYKYVGSRWNDQASWVECYCQ